MAKPPLKPSKNKEITNAEPTEEEINRIRNKICKSPMNLDDTRFIAPYLKLKQLPKRTKEEEKKMRDLAAKAGCLHNLENGFWVMNIAPGENGVLTIAKMRRQLVDEYNCSTASELMLVDKIVAAYWRSMQYEYYIHHLIREVREDGHEVFSFKQTTPGILKELHKGLDLADRELQVHLTLLKELRQPKLNIKVNTENAYFAQNQQVINENQGSPSDPNTINTK